jgi:hypothetical protein
MSDCQGKVGTSGAGLTSVIAPLSLTGTELSLNYQQPLTLSGSNLQLAVGGGLTITSGSITNGLQYIGRFNLTTSAQNIISFSSGVYSIYVILDDATITNTSWGGYAKAIVVNNEMILQSIATNNITFSKTATQLKLTQNAGGSPFKVYYSNDLLNV